MPSSLAEKMAFLNLANGDSTPTSHSNTKSPEEIKKDLEDEFLRPPTTFSAAWLNKLQQRWDYQSDHTELCQMAPTQTRTITRFTREGLEGRVTGYKEVTVPASSATAKNSTSILRKPASRADFVRGAAGFFPFAPGGLDGVDAIQAYEDQARIEEIDRRVGMKRGLDRIINFGTEDGLLSIPPGFTRGMTFRDKNKEAEEAANDIENVLNEEGASIEEKATNGNTNGEVESTDVTTSDQDEEDDDTDLDDLLPVEFAALQPKGQLAASSSTRGGREWAHVVDINKDLPNFKELVPEMARTWPFELDIFQKEAVYHLENGDSVFVAAHTSAGKTVVAEYAIALAAKHMTKAIYTSPIKALSNQKFRDFKGVFEDVGILTGDVQINPEASCLIMTTEILRSMLYRGADLIRDVEFVIFDEVHYVNDLERGVVWEEVIIMLPEHVTLILLSATVPNTYEFASWVGRTKKKNIYVISTPKRPVPLEHYLWAGKDMHKIVDSEKRFIEKGWKAANDILSGLDKVKEQKAAESAPPTRGGANQRGARGQQPRGGQRGGNPQQRGRGGQSSNRGTGNIARSGRGGGRTTAAQDRTIWVNVVAHLKKQNLLPCCIFVFSKKRCEENAESLSNQDFSTAAEKSAIHMTIEKSIARLKPDDRVLPQIRRIREMLERGVAVHHGGLLPIVKEIVEILFAKTLVKVLFATETFAMGLNLPTRTVVFSGYRKHDGREFRSLLPGEYTQMAGRAGRRGLDTVGSVIIVTSGKNEAPPAGELRTMILGQPTKLRSQFRLHYNMILNLMRVEALKIEEMIKRSFSENATQALLPQHEKQVQLSQANLDKIRREPCDICDIDLEACHEAATRFQEITKDLHLFLLSSPIGKRILNSRRLIVFRKDGIRTAGILIEDGYRPSGFKVLAVENIDAKRTNKDMLPYLPHFRPLFDPLPSNDSQVKTSVCNVGIDDLEAVTETIVKVRGPAWYIRVSKEQKKFAEKDFIENYADWVSPIYNEQDWSKAQELKIRELLGERSKMAAVSQKAKCLECPHFLKHYGMQHDEWLIKENIQSLQMLMSDQNLALLPDYNQRVEVLKDLGFVDEESRVQLKGKVACEIHSADELVLSECIFENVFADYEPEDIVALLSAFVFQEKTDDLPAPPEHLLAGIASINKIIDRVSEIQTTHQVILSSDDLSNTSHAEQIATSTNPPLTSTSGPSQPQPQANTNTNTDRRNGPARLVTAMHQHPRFALVEVVYNWALGMSFNRITDLTDVMEGTIVRVVTRLDETCREVMSAARLVGDPGLHAKMERAREMIRRDVVFCASLYM